MSYKIKKTIELIKKAYDQPILFQILHNHLSYIVKDVSPTYEMVDDWSKILIYSCHSHKMPNQGLELKIQNFLNANKPPITTNDQKLKLICICYYFMNRSPAQINHIALFGLVSSFLGFVSDHIDGMIIKMVSNVVLARIYELEDNRKMNSASLFKIISMIKERDLCISNKVKSLPCFIYCDFPPISVADLNIQPNYLGYKCLESISIYAKYASNTRYLQEILPSSEYFLEDLQRFLGFDFSFESKSTVDFSKCLVQDKSIYKMIKEGYDNAEDKNSYVSDLIEYISSLK